MAHSRKIVIGGNWKMNLLSSQIQSYAEELLNNISNDGKADVIIAPPFVMLQEAIRCFKNTGVFVAAQNVSEYDSGAYTGEVSASQLYDLGVTHVLAGHSERRHIFGETDFSVNAKVLQILKNSMRPILCVGETLSARENGQTENVIAAQLKEGLKGVSPQEISRVIVAYEPVWAIGTGNTATVSQAEDVCAFIRSILTGLYGEKADPVPIIYGGSMNAENAEELIGAPNIDGGLIGGASLIPQSFARIINTAKTSI